MVNNQKNIYKKAIMIFYTQQHKPVYPACGRQAQAGITVESIFMQSPYISIAVWCRNDSANLFL
jgi:hypothetical protein